MKAVLLAPLPPPNGGMATWAKRVIDAKLINNWETTIIDEKVTGDRKIFGAKAKRNYFNELKRCRHIWKQLKKELKGSEVAVVHSSIPSTTTAMLREWVCAKITHNNNKKFIIHFHCTVPNTTKSRVGLLVLKKLCKKSDLIISLNLQTTQMLENICDTPVRQIGNFISDKEIAQSRIINDEIKTIIFVGGIIEGKGIFDVLEVAKKMPDITFRFVGEGDDSIPEYAKANRIDNAVFVGGKKPNEIGEELDKADAFIFLSHFRSEGFSIALTEALASGLPCIVTDWSANADMVSGTGGKVVEVGDIEGTVEAINILRPKKIREEVSRLSIEKVKNNYTEDIILEKYVRAYEEAVGGLD